MTKLTDIDHLAIVIEGSRIEKRTDISYQGQRTYTAILQQPSTGNWILELYEKSLIIHKNHH